MPDVIVTGLPRAGSATVSALIDSLPDAVTFNLPVAPMRVADKPLEILPYCKWLVGDYLWTRRTLLNMEPVADFRAADGKPLLDGLFDPRRKVKDSTDEPDLVYFTKANLSNDFTLSMRHHTLFTSILPTLVKFSHFKIIATIRHPLDVLASWKGLPQPMITTSNPNGIARFWPEALALMETNASEVEKAVQLYDAFIGRYHELRDHITIVRYEDVVEDPAIIPKMFGAKEISATILELIEKSPQARITAETKIIRDAFKKYGVYTKLYYPDI